MLTVEIDQNSGFCFGVVYAIEMAEEARHEMGIGNDVWITCPAESIDIF